MARIAMDKAIEAGLKRASIGLTGDTDSPAILEEFVDAVIDHVSFLSGGPRLTTQEKRQVTINALRQIGFDYSADAIRDYREV